MSKIPYYFETPIPRYFREHGWFDDENTLKFVIWAFSKCSTEPRKVVIDGKEIILAPFEFIAGRLSSPKECHLTEKQWRGQLFAMQKCKLIQKTSNSRANRFSCYIWMVEMFTCNKNQTEVQQKGQRRANRGPTEGHNLEEENKRSKEDHPSIPSYEEKFETQGPGMTDDFSSAGKEGIEIVSGVFLDPEALEACIAIKGSEEKVREAIAHIQASPKRKHSIADWPNTLATWKIQDSAKGRIKEHIVYTEKLCREFESFEQGDGWRCRMYTDPRKDVRGILFECQSAYQEAVFVALADGELKTKCEEFIEKNAMRIKQNC